MKPISDSSSLISLFLLDAEHFRNGAMLWTATLGVRESGTKASWMEPPQAAATTSACASARLHTTIRTYLPPTYRMATASAAN